MTDERAAEAPRPPGHVRLFRLGSLDVEAHVTLPVLLLLAAALFAEGLLPAQEGDAAYTRPAFWLMGLAGSVLLLLSVLLHELGHVLAARAVGMRVNRVSLFHHSGSAAHDQRAETPWAELAVAGAGPAVTLAIAGVGALCFDLLRDVRYAAPLLRFLSVTNIVLALSWLLPGLPLDGGRLLRAAAWGLTGTLLAGSRVAFLLGRAFALGLGAVSTAMLLREGASSLWLLGTFLGLVLWLQAGSHWRTTRRRERLAGLRAGDLMSPPPPPVSRAVSVNEALLDPTRLGVGLPRSFLVDFGGRLGGLVTMSDLRRVPPEERDSTPVGQVTRKLRREHLISPWVQAEAALRRMVEERLPLLPVVAEGRLLGVLTRDSLLRVVDGRDPLVA